MTIQEELQAKIQRYEADKKVLEEKITLHELELRLDKGQLTVINTALRSCKASMEKLK